MYRDVHFWLYATYGPLGGLGTGIVDNGVVSHTDSACSLEKGSTGLL